MLRAAIGAQRARSFKGYTFRRTKLFVKIASHLKQLPFKKLLLYLFISYWSLCLSSLCIFLSIYPIYLSIYLLSIISCLRCWWMLSVLFLVSFTPCLRNLPTPAIIHICFYLFIFLCIYGFPLFMYMCSYFSF